MKDDTVYLEHILEAIRKIESYLTDVSFESFCQDDMRLDAVVRELEIIGEASRNLSEVFQNDHREIPFREITDMRNILIHKYFGINIKMVWDTCVTDIPILKEDIQKLLPEV